MHKTNIVRLTGETDDEWKRRYHRAYYQANKGKWARAAAKLDPAKVKEAKSAYYQANKERLKAKASAYHAANRDSCRARAKAYYEANKEHHSQRCRAYYNANKPQIIVGQKAWTAAHPEARRKHRAKWWRNNPEKTAAYWANRDARERNACPPWADLNAIKEIYREARRLSKARGIIYHVDHIVPIAGENVCGLHVSWNLRIIPGSENVRKSNKLTDEALHLCLSTLRAT